MNSILPIQEIRARFDRPIAVEQLGMDQLGEIVARHPHRILNTAATVWRRHIQANPTVNPQAVEEHQQKHGGTFLQGVQAVIGEPIIKDISFSRCKVDDPFLNEPLVAYLLVARVFPNDVHIADLNLMNPYKPIPPKLRQYRFRQYKGLGLLGTVLARSESYAVEHHCGYITLTSDADDLVPLFGKHGFVLEDDEVLSLAMVKKIQA